jgi:hypothetical protein
MIIGFTGHRDYKCSEQELVKLAEEYPNSLWVHGGASGFDTQVKLFVKNHGHKCGITQKVIRPEFSKYPPYYAPLKRNETIVDMSDMLVACYDGRQAGGTYFTVEYAKRLGKQIIYTSYAAILK